MTRRWIGTLLVLIIGFSIPIFYKGDFSAPLNLHDISFKQTINLLAQLVFYALIIERITEVYVDSVFSSQKAGIKATYLNELDDLERERERLTELDAKKSVDLYTEQQKRVQSALWKLDSKKDDENINLQWLNLTNTIREHAIIFSLVCGVLLSLVGINMLSSLTTGEIASGSLQATLRTSVDVIMTGLLLAGGAAGIHPIINKLKNFAAPA